MSVLFLGPHLDDVAFSCGGLVARTRRNGIPASVCTVFTQGIVPAHGFALECQTSKGIPADVDYLALRRQEDCAFAAIVGGPALEWWDVFEAPYRGYDSPAALFGPIAERDAGLVPAIAERLVETCARLHVDRLVVPRGVGGHVDHVLVCDAVAAALKQLAPTVICDAYEEMPYCMRSTSAPASFNGPAIYEPIDEVLEQKIAGACAYRSQIGFQFGDTERLRDIVVTRAAQVARLAGGGHAHCEALVRV